VQHRQACCTAVCYCFRYYDITKNYRFKKLQKTCVLRITKCVGSSLRGGTKSRSEQRYTTRPTNHPLHKGAENFIKFHGLILFWCLHISFQATFTNLKILCIVYTELARFFIRLHIHSVGHKNTIWCKVFKISFKMADGLTLCTANP